jgi:hypothetical protein
VRISAKVRLPAASYLPTAPTPPKKHRDFGTSRRQLCDKATSFPAQREAGLTSAGLTAAADNRPRAPPTLLKCEGLQVTWVLAFFAPGIDAKSGPIGVVMELDNGPDADVRRLASIGEYAPPRVSVHQWKESAYVH